MEQENKIIQETKIIQENNITQKHKAISQYDLNGNFIKRWDGLYEILHANTNYSLCAMRKCLISKTNIKYNFIWKYVYEGVKLKDDEVFVKIGKYNLYNLNSYEISNYGNIKNINHTNVLRILTMQNGYYYFNFYNYDTHNTDIVWIHELVATHFIKNKPGNDYIVHHKDNNKLNNHFKNLEWILNPNKHINDHEKKIKQIDITWIEYANFISLNNIELWENIIDFPDYDVSTIGRIKIIKSGRIGNNHVGHFLTPHNCGGYYEVTLKNNTHRKTIKVHVLVAKAFIPNNDPVNKIEVDHINRDRLNNTINNLRWVTHAENMKEYAKTIEYKGKKIYQYDLNNNLVKEWGSIRELLDVNKEYSYHSMLKCLSGQLEKLYNYKWKYAENKEITVMVDELFVNVNMFKEYDFSNYKISNYGNVKNIDRDNILNGKTGKSCYREACMYDKITGKSTYVKIHQLVATKFIGEKPSEKHVVNHKDKNKLNNHVSNLEWITGQANTEHGCARAVQQLDINTGDVVNSFKSIKEAVETCKLSKNARVNISQCCLGKNRTTAFGYKWRYIDV